MATAVDEGWRVNVLQPPLMCFAGSINRSDQNVIEFFQKEVRVSTKRDGERPRFNAQSAPVGGRCHKDRTGSTSASRFSSPDLSVRVKGPWWYRWIRPP